MTKFFLDASGGSLAFKKEQDYPDWDNAVYVSGADVTLASLPASDFSETSKQLDVTNIRRAILLIKLDTEADTYDFTIYGGANSGNILGWYPLDGEVRTSESGSKLIGVDVFGYEYLTVLFVTPPSNGCDVEMAPVPYEETD